MFQWFLWKMKEHYLAIRLFVVSALTFCGLIVRPFDSYCQGNVSCKINLPAIAKIESSNNPKAFNKLDHGGLGSRGLFQVSEVLRKDFNLKNKTNFSKEDLFNPKINTRIADWYLNKEIPRLIKFYAKKHPYIVDSVESRLTAFNMGILALIKKRQAHQYINKYRSFAHV